MKKSLHFKISVYILSIFAAIFLITTFIIGGRLHYNADKEARDYSVSVARETSYFLETYLTHAYDVSDALALAFLALREQGTPSRKLVLDMLKEQLQANPDFYAIWTIWEPDVFDGKDHEYAQKYGYEKSFFSASAYRAKGKILYENYGSDENPNYISDSDFSVYQKDYYRIPKQRKKQNIDEVETYNYSGEAGDDVSMLSVTVPIMKDGKFLGALGVDLRFSFFTDLLENIHFYKKGFAAVFSHSGIVNVHPDKHLLGKQVKEAIGDFRPQIAENVAAGKSYTYIANSLYSQTKVLRVFFPISLGKSDLKWTLMLEVPVREINAKVREVVYLFVLIAVISMLIILLGIWFISRNITAPLADITSVAEKISLGKIQSHVSTSGRKDEIGELENYMQKMSGRLQEMITSIQKNAHSVKDLGRTLHVMSNELNERTGEQNVLVERASESIAEVSQGVHKSFQHTSETNTIAKQSVEGIKQNNLSLAQAVESVKQIAEKINVVNSIASQTNLLALNASIEAARAGVHGKGFAVVAAEVSSLAEMSKTASKEIVELAKHGLEITEKSGRETQEIVPLIEKVSQLVANLTATLEEQSVESGLVNSSLQELAKVAEENSSSAHELSVTAESLLEQAEVLRELIAFFAIEK